jgi:membrane-bound serine protease (ClpP class)
MEIGLSKTCVWRKAAIGAWRLAVVLGALLGAMPGQSQVSPGHRHAVVLDVNGAIGPAIADYVTRELSAIHPDDTGLVVLRMDTPGGLDSSMREIIRAILASPVPVAAYVAPSGARAASAGTYITYACAVAAMAPGTNLGAATPIQIGVAPQSSPGQPKEAPADSPGKRTGGDAATNEPPAGEAGDPETRKMVNDAVAYIRGLAELNGRNADWAVEAVRRAVSLPATAALALHVVDVIARDVPDLLRQVDGRTAVVQGVPQRLATADLDIVTVKPDWRTEFLGVLTNPNIAYLLLLLGAYGLIFEATSPGAVLPGLVGGISLLLALFGLNLLPVNYAGAALLLLGIGLMVAEAVIGAFGVIGIGGVVAFAFGSIMTFRSAPPGFGISLSIVIGATIVSAGFFLFALTALLRSRRRPVITGKEALIGARGETMGWQDKEGRVRVQGEIWRARCAHVLEPGTQVKVIGREGLVLVVEPL